ncbi:hypothetical protein Cpir12675_001967 [Ceratocystis pirilliformis]|uniref:PH domain-containing protein n=1 Tax=Ceratocystis pirilliformis TaxID=259994 RepID=A0ABR3ZDE4_9PEZI
MSVAIPKPASQHDSTSNTADSQAPRLFHKSNTNDSISRQCDRRILGNSPVDQNGSFEFDRVLKSGYVQKRTQKTKTWKSVFVVLRPTSLSIYKTERETKLRNKIELADLTAVVHLKDPKHKRDHVFGLFSPSRNYHLQASSEAEANNWVDLIRTQARIEEEEEEMFLQSPQVRSGAAFMDRMFNKKRPMVGESGGCNTASGLNDDRVLSSSPELQVKPPTPRLNSPPMSMVMDYSGLSGNEMASDFSDADVPRRFVPIASDKKSASVVHEDDPATAKRLSMPQVPPTTNSVGHTTVPDPDRVIWHDWLWMQRSKGGVRQWRNYWAVLRPRNLILYRDQTEYTAQFILPLGSIVNAVDMDPVSKTKKYCLQVITEEKTFKFCAHDEESLVQCLGAFKSLLAKRRELEAAAAAHARN